MTIRSSIPKHVLALAALGLLACGGVEEPGEGGPDAGMQVEPPDAADPESPDAAPVQCQPGQTGPDCDECADEWHDVNDDGTCTPTCEATGDYARNCGDYGTCVVDQSNGDRLCECDEGHEGFSCENCLDGYELDGDGACQLTLPSATDMVLWLDADQDSSLLMGNDNGVSSWKDRRGGSNPTLTQSTVAARPVYVADGMNGRPVIHFQGASALQASSFDGLRGDDYTIFVVFSPGPLGGDTLLRTTNLEHGTTFLFERVSPGMNYRASHYAPFGNAGADQVTTQLGHASSDKLFMIRRASSGLLKLMSITTNKSGEIDGDVQLNGTLTQTSISLSHRLTLGDLDLTGDLAEVIIYDRTISNTEVEEIQTYLATKWNIENFE
jgi:hypothetical protein